jgi:protein lifeguard
MAPFLFGGLMALVATGLVGIFIPFSKTIDLVYAAGGCVIFSGYVVYDTFVINKKLSPDEYIMGAISLYLDFINLCKFISHFLRDADLYLPLRPRSLVDPPCPQQCQQPIKR